MEQSKVNELHRPLGKFFYGSLAVIILALSIGAYYLSHSFIEKEKNRANISSIQIQQSLNSDHRYIVEEFFTSSYESIFIRVSNSLQKFGSPRFELYLYNNEKECLLGKNQIGDEIPCRKNPQSVDGLSYYSSGLKLGTAPLGEMVVLVEDKFQFFTGSVWLFALKNFMPVFFVVIVFWGVWALLSRKFILVPYYKKMIAIEKEKVSTDIIRQIIHDTKSEIASLDLSIYELEDQQKANEMRKTLHNIREAFGNLSHHKEGIVTTVREAPLNALSLFTDFVEQQKIKYKKHTPAVVIRSSFTAQFGHKIKVDENTFYRVLSNLVENAVTAPNTEGMSDIQISFTETKDSVLISVSDNADGLSEEAQKRIFEKGFTTKQLGSGQGLSFVKMILDSWNGKIHFETKMKSNRSTSFTIEIPTYDKPKVVILDDNTSLLYRYKKIVERYGHQAEVFTEVSAFLDRSKSFELNTIFLLDFNLSDNTNGADVARKLSELGMKEVYLHTGNPSIDKSSLPFIKDILSKGNFMDTMKKIGL